MGKQTIGSLVTLLFVLPAALVIVTSLMIGGAPLAAADNAATASISATMAEVLDLTVVNAPTWSTILKGADNTIITSSALQVSIGDTTNVIVSIQFGGSTNLVSGSYTIPIGNIYFDENTTFGTENDYLRDYAVENRNVLWMQNIPVPTLGAGATTNNAYFFLSTADDQHAGDYTGTLYVKAVSS